MICSYWIEGTAAAADRLDVIIPRYVELVRQIGAKIGANTDTAKDHDIWHIAYDVRMFGSARGTSTGMLACICCESILYIDEYDIVLQLGRKRAITSAACRLNDPRGVKSVTSRK